jgi:DNA polymerase (family 10)
MPIHNRDVAEMFDRMADLLEIQGANPFRVRAYRNAARTVGDLPRSVADMIADEEDLSDLPGIGKDLAGKIEEIVRTGAFSALAELAREVPAGLADLTALPGLGPKRVKALHDQLGVSDLEDLQRIALKQRIRDLPGFGEKTEERILRALRRRTQTEQRHRLADVEDVAQSLVAYLKAVAGVKQVVVAGSYRRRKETVGDLDILVTCTKDAPVMKRFVEYDEVEEVVAQGTTRSTVLLRSGLQVDLRVVAEASYGAALHYFTGSKAHNIAVRQMGVKKKLKINEYGVFKGTKRVAGRTEEEVFAQVGLPYIEPELREDQGEIEAARKKRLPKLIVLEDIRGDLHNHTKATDGKYSARQMAEAAEAHGYEYLAVTDHSKRVTVAHGMDEKRLRKQMAEIDRLNAHLRGIVLLKGVEVDVLEDGTLDLDDSVLADLDLVVGAIHSKLSLTRDQQTERIIRAMDNPHFSILAHPTGRLIGERDPYDIDLERVMDAAVERGCYLELNAHPSRLDLNDVSCRMAKEKGLKVAISTDAHTTAGLDTIRFGIEQARRGWLEPDDVLNTRSLRKLRKLLKR